MAENSKVRWAPHTQNFWWGCNKVSQECRCCYIGPIMRVRAVSPLTGPCAPRTGRSLSHRIIADARTSDNGNEF